MTVRYYRRSSYSQLEITGNVLGGYKPAYPRSSVVQSTVGREDLIKEALNYYNSEGHDFTHQINEEKRREPYVSCQSSCTGF
jgi:hypothetical protein